jgi:hypothetical protein
MKDTRFVRVLQWGNRYFAESWRLIPFQPILFLAMWIGAWLVILTGNEPLHLENISEHIYTLWAGAGLTAPLLYLGSRFLILHKPGIWRYRGYWLRLAADVAEFAVLSSFLLSRFEVGFLDADYRTFALTILVGCDMFILFLIVRDIWKLALTESVANYLHNAHDEGDLRRREFNTQTQLLKPEQQLAPFDREE